MTYGFTTAASRARKSRQKWVASVQAFRKSDTRRVPLALLGSKNERFWCMRVPVVAHRYARSVRPARHAAQGRIVGGGNAARQWSFSRYPPPCGLCVQQSVYAVDGVGVRCMTRIGADLVVAGNDTVTSTYAAGLVELGETEIPAI
jgi:hypothetical protein